MKKVILILGLTLYNLICYSQETETFKDIRNGKIYKTVKIGTQTWMAENLAYKADSGCWACQGCPDYLKTYGYLYNWKSAINVCPVGWHLPSDSEWTVLEIYLQNNGFNFDGTIDTISTKRVEYNKIAKSMASKTHWNFFSDKGCVGNIDSPDYQNKSGFSALPSGYHTWKGIFDHIGYRCTWWSSTEDSENYAWTREMTYHYEKIFRTYLEKDFGFSVRCIKD